MQSTDAEFAGVLDKIVPAVSLFGDEAQRLKLSLSPKAVVTASTDKLARALQKELLTYGMKFGIDGNARDLGIAHTAASSRPSKLLASRFAKRTKKIMKVKKLAKVGRKCRKLFTGSVYSSATWGHQAAGLSDSCILELEREALACTGINPAGRCRKLGLIAAFGMHGSPRSRLERETIRAWFDVLKVAR